MKMKKSRYLRQVQGQIHKTVRKIRLSNRIAREAENKEELILTKLEASLGKPKEEVQKMISDGLMKILTMVPITEK